LLCVGFCGYSVMRKLGSSVVSPLSGRYVLLSLSKINLQILMGKFGLILALFYPKLLMLWVYFSFWWLLIVLFLWCCLPFDSTG
ncbi:hypothetical protein, partial [Vibrio metschnikovii]|uniref:hypothetical protein n=1 Tax=Vibrio metschnikovii TaxID=28172 RepID=UPI002FCC0EA5